jgi:hypothetical protein
MPLVTRLFLPIYAIAGFAIEARQCYRVANPRTGGRLQSNDFGLGEFTQARKGAIQNA